MLLAGVGSSFAFEYGGLTYRIIDSDAKTVKVSYQGSSEMNMTPYTLSTVNIPSTVPFNESTYTVVEIGDYAFQNAYSLSSITIPSTVKTIGNYAFQYTSFTSIDLSTIENIGDGIFGGCTNLSSVKLPETLTEIPNSMFWGCTSLTSFTFTDKIERIGDSAFGATGITTITIPKTVREIGGSAFGNCEKLKNVYILNNIGYGLGTWIFNGSNNITKIVCLDRCGRDFGFTDDVKEGATVIVPESQVSNWKSNGFFNVQAADVNNVGGHVVDVAAYGASGSVRVNGQYADGMYGQAFVVDPSTDVELKFGSYDEVWQLATFTLNGVDKFSDVVDNKYTIKDISGNQNIIATWAEGASYNLSTYFNSEGGNIYINGNQVWNETKKYPINKTITLLIQPNTGYGISSFNVGMVDKKGDLIDNSDGTYSYTFTLTADTDVNIFFDKKWTLTTTFNAGGSVTIGGESVTSGTVKEIVGPGSEVVVKPNQGYEITSVLYNGNDYLANMTDWAGGEKVFWPSSDQGDNQTLAVTFTVVNPTVSANYDTSMGSVSIAGSQLMPGTTQSYAIGSNVTFTVTPFLGYEIQQVMLYAADGTATDITTAVKTNGNSYTISNIGGSYSINVMFGTIPAPADVTATIGTLGMATLYSPYALDFSGVTGLKAYIVSAFTPANNRAILTQVYDVPAKTSVVLVGAAADYTIPTTTTKTYVANLLRGADCDMKMNSTDGVYTNYILADGTNGLGFYVIQDGSTLNAGKAYLAIPNDATSPAPSFVVMNLNGMDVTGIESIEKAASNMAGNAIYNLNGQRQSGLKKGINIVGGKKIVVK